MVKLLQEEGGLAVQEGGVVRSGLLEDFLHFGFFGESFGAFLIFCCSFGETFGGGCAGSARSAGGWCSKKWAAGRFMNCCPLQLQNFQRWTDNTEKGALANILSEKNIFHQFVKFGCHKNLIRNAMS